MSKQPNEAKSVTIGRFAPSPTGPLHQGSLTAALASYLFAKYQGGRWLLRIEDVDRLRALAGADAIIMQALRAHGLHWDGPVVYQSQRTRAYQHALQALFAQKLIYACGCSRKQVQERNAGIYDGYCREQIVDSVVQGKALRINFAASENHFVDGLLGECEFKAPADRADFVILRRDGFFAYQLAVVVDDAACGVNQVVRGMDIIDSTPRQRYLNQLLGYPQPDYFHIPLVRDKAGRKLSKSDTDKPLTSDRCCQNLCQALEFLGQPLPPAEQQKRPERIIKWALDHFEPAAIPCERSPHH